MIAQLASTFWTRLGPAWLTGPIFDKELRVASRQRRSYILRFAYVIFLTLSLLCLWFAIPNPKGTGTAVVRVSRLGELGKGIVCAVIWLQFLSVQLLGVLLLSDTIGSEVRQRTLDALLVTPVRSFQIVVGKLLSKLLQTASLVAISLPVLAVVRVFGGVPWDFLVAGLCVTVSVGVFAGVMSLFLSISNRSPYHTALIVGLFYLIVWGLVPITLIGLLRTGYLQSASAMSVLHHTNPFVVMSDLTRQLLSSSGGVGMSQSWHWHCVILLGLAALLVVWSVLRVRRIALRVVVLRVDEGGNTQSRRRRRSQRPIRPVTGSPIAWKERCASLSRTRGYVVFGIGAALILASSICVMLFAGGPAYIVFFPLTQSLQLLFMAALAVMAAGAISKEREARTWPILLTTPLDNWEIIKGKATGVFQRNLPLLIPLLTLHLLSFLFMPISGRTVVHFVSWVGLLLLALSSMSFFLLGTGLYFSSRLKTTGAAVVATLAVYYVPKLFFCGFLSPLFVLSSGMASGMSRRSGYPMMLVTVLISIAPAIVYAGLGLLFMRLATARVRRDIF